MRHLNDHDPVGDLPRLLPESQKHLICMWFMFHRVLCLSSYALVLVLWSLCYAVLCCAVPHHANSDSHGNAHTGSGAGIAERQPDTSLC